MTSIKLTAPAKVNLLLKVFGKRNDGYHNIVTLFERITLADDITISRIPEGIKISSDKFITANPKDNIAYRAARLLLKHKKVEGGIKIYIKKRIPIAGGMGGGSSDAASVLIGIDKIYRIGLNQKELMRLARTLGADVPFFILNSPFAVGRSRGDILSRLNLKVRLWHLIIYPGFKLATKDIYEAFDCLQNGLTKKVSGDKIRFRFKPPMDFNGMESMLYNDLHDTAVAKKRVLGGIIRRLAYSLEKKMVISGSGPSLFCLYRTRKEAQRARRILLKSVPGHELNNWQIFIAATKV